MSRKLSGKSPIFHVKYMVKNPVGEAKEEFAFTEGELEQQLGMASMVVFWLQTLLSRRYLAR